ncbi:MAG TPA: hypothetical protein VHM88_01655 [Candidatus Acidoferrales bacterium]|jgi:hypothetical protein|nr:hypothetical protein [Candidatus Acidoferrales bacterium]
MGHLLNGIQFRRSHRTADFGHEQFVDLLKFLREQAIKVIYKLNSVAVECGTLSHALVAAARPRVERD